MEKHNPLVDEYIENLRNGSLKEKAGIGNMRKRNN